METGRAACEALMDGEINGAGGCCCSHIFFFQAEDGIRDLTVTGVQTCALPISYEISQAQNPQLTISASADPITFGQQVTISGTAPGAPSTPVTLLAHIAKQRGFVTVSQAKTDAAGNYTFPAQAPATNTFYRVRASGRQSAVLYEGVRDLLTAQVSASTIEEIGRASCRE